MELVNVQHVRNKKNVIYYNNNIIKLYNIIYNGKITK